MHVHCHEELTRVYLSQSGLGLGPQGSPVPSTQQTHCKYLWDKRSQYSKSPLNVIASPATLSETTFKENSFTLGSLM